MTNHRRQVLATLLSLSQWALAPALAAGAEVRKAVGSIELADAAGDESPITTSDHEYPASTSSSSRW